MSPKKNAHVCIGWKAMTYTISLANENMLMSTPAKSDTRNAPWMNFQNSLNLPDRSSFHDDGSIRAFNASISSVKMPVRSAMVPPETPGITLAAPIPKPFTPVMKCFVRFAMSLFYYC